MHKDLQADVLARKVEMDSFILVRDLPTFTDMYIVPYLTSRKDFAILVQNNKVPGLDLGDVCDRNTDTLIEAVNKSPSVMIGDPGTYEPEVDVIEVPKDFHVEQASQVSKNLLLVTFEFQADVYFTFFLPRTEYYGMSDEETGQIAVLEPDWNEYVMQVEKGTPVKFKCRLTFNSDTQEVESFEVEDVESVDEYE
jgi:hypothetical protein